MPVRCVQGARSQGPIINGLCCVPRPSEEPERAATLAPAASAGGNPRCDAIGTVVACGADLSREGTEDSSPAQNDRGGGCDSNAPPLCGRRHLHQLQVQEGSLDATRSGPSLRVGLISQGRAPRILRRLRRLRMTGEGDAIPMPPRCAGGDTCTCCKRRRESPLRRDRDRRRVWVLPIRLTGTAKAPPGQSAEPLAKPTRGLKLATSEQERRQTGRTANLALGA